MTDQTKVDEKNMRKIWIAKSSIRDFSNPTEPNLYPDKFVQLVLRSDYDALKAENERLRVALGEIADPTSAFSKGRKISFLDYELRKIAREALSGKGE